MRTPALSYFVVIALSAVIASLLPGCVYMGVAPDDGTVAYARQEPLATPVFETAAVSVTGDYFGAGFRYPGVIEDAQRQAWTRIRDAFEEKRLVKAVGGGGKPGQIEVYFEFLIEDDDNPFHRGVSRLTLFIFPHWKMVRCSARARCRVKGELLPGFMFEDEVLVYRSPALLPFGPFNTEDPLDRLFTAAARSLTGHVLRWVQIDFPTLLKPHRMVAHD